MVNDVQYCLVMANDEGQWLIRAELKANKSNADGQQVIS